MRSPLLLSFLLLGAVLLPHPAHADDVAPSALEIRPLLIGSRIPDVAVQTVEGERVSLPEALGEAPVVLVVVRGGW